MPSAAGWWDQRPRQDAGGRSGILLRQVQLIPAGQADAEDKAVGQVASMFTTHSRLEDEFLTPMLSELHPELAAESDDEHEQAKRLLAKIEDLPAGLARRHVMAEFSEVVKAHTVTQEASVFPFLIEMLDVGELENLGRRMRAAEQLLRQTAADTTGAAETAGHRVYPQL